MIRRFVLFGATGDLAGRFVLPALAALHAAHKLPDGFSLVASGRQEFTDATFRHHASRRFAEHARSIPVESHDALLRAMRYERVDFGDTEDVAGVVRGVSAGEPVAAYLATPPQTFEEAVGSLAEARLPTGSRIVVEKPYGTDLRSARALNAMAARFLDVNDDVDLFRVDHVLGMATVQNLIGLRMANPVLEAVWNGAHVEQVDILWEELLALEGRGSFFDLVGTTRDVIQNHVLQILSIVAMEPPPSVDAQHLRDAKVSVLEAIRPPSTLEMRTKTRRARYTAGQLAGADPGRERDVPDYVAEEGVDPDNSTETFAEVTVEIDTPRWVGTRFVLRAGKALERKRKGVLVRFRLSPDRSSRGAAGSAANQLWIGIDDSNEICLELNGMTSGPQHSRLRVALTAPPPPSDLPPYGHVLLDVLAGGNTLSVRGDEAEAAWRVLTPVLDAWTKGLVPMEHYAAGSSGPVPRG